MFAADHATCFSSNVSEARGLCLGDLRPLLAVDPHVVPKEGKKVGGKEKMGRGDLLVSFVRSWATEQCVHWKSSSRRIRSPGNARGSWGVWEWVIRWC